MRPIPIENIVVAIYKDNAWKNKIAGNTFPMTHEEFYETMVRQDVTTNETTIRVKWKALALNNTYCERYDRERDVAYINFNAVEETVRKAEAIA